MVKPPDKRPGISDMGHLFCIFVELISIHHVFAQDVPCKFVIALSFENNTREESRNNWHFKWPNGFMSPFSIKCQFIRFCLTPRVWEITSFPSNGEDPKKLGEQVL